MENEILKEILTELQQLNKKYDEIIEINKTIQKENLELTNLAKEKLIENNSKRYSILYRLLAIIIALLLLVFLTFYITLISK